MPTELTLDELVLHHAAAAACALPSSVKRALAGGPIVRDGQTLDPEVALLMRLSERTGRQLPRSPSAAFIRAQQNKGARIAGGPADGAPSRDLTIAGAAGPLPARHYPAAEGAPLLVYLHGGGFVFGDLDTHDAPCRVLRRHGGVHVLSVDYRLAPEHPFPAAVEDARAALAWAQGHARELGADPDRIGVGGDSAGANLAAVVAQLARREGGGRPPACQLLVYPAVDRRRPWRSLDLFSDGYYLTREAIDWFHRQYTGPHAASTAPDPRLNPLAGEDLRDLPPALVVTAGFDPLRDEGEAYAGAMREAGNHVTVRRFESLVHGFFNMVGVSRVCREAVVEIAGATRVLFTKGSA